MNNIYSTKNRTRKVAWITVLMVLLLFLVGSAGVYQHTKAQGMERELTNQYSRAFEDLVYNIENLDATLAKCVVAGSTTQIADLATNIYRIAAFAQANLGELPISHIELDNTANFLSQVGDFTYSLSKKVLRGEEISDAEYKDLIGLSEYCTQLKNTLAKMQEDIFSGNVSFNEISKEGEELSKDGKTNIGDGMQNIEEEFGGYASLIYDGPFSEHMNKLEAKHLRSGNDISKEEAMQKVKKYLEGKNIKEINPTGESDGTIKAYSFTAVTSDDKEIYISITKKGGYLLYMLENRNVSSRYIDIIAAIQKGSEFLKQHGINSMKESYTDIVDNIATINYAYVQDGITMYPDLVKIKVALDNGEIMGFESQGYLMAHEDTRGLSEIKVSREQAEEKINPHLKINSYSLAVIPLDSSAEVLCHEFKGTFNDKSFLIYVNADTGYEEKILIIIDTEEGNLTM